MPDRASPRWLRITFATRLLIAGVVLSVVLIASVSVFLIASRDQQTSGAAASNADNRAKLLRQLVQRVTEPQARSAAVDLASLHSLQAALQGSQPGTDVAALFQPGAPAAGLVVSDMYVVVLDRSGKVVFTSEPVGTSVPHVSAALESVKSTLATGKSNEGVEMLGDRDPAYDFAVPVCAGPCPGGSASVIGVSMYTAPLASQLNRFASAATYPIAFIPNDLSNRIFRVTADKKGDAVITIDAAPVPLRGQAGGGQDVFAAQYHVTGAGDVAADFVALRAVDPDKIGGYIGVELPLADFAASSSKDKITVVLMALTAVAVTAFAVVVFVNRYVQRPVRTLQRGVARIASGDYATDVPVIRQDELGDLATMVNRMRLQIQSYIRHIDGAVQRLSDVSRALTTTANGVEPLQSAVLAAAAGMVGGTGAVTLYQWDVDHGMFAASRSEPADTVAPEIAGDRAAALMNGAHLRWQDGADHLLALPMYYQEKVVGALVTVTPREAQETDERALVALANNATIAQENTRLFEQEKETVARLRELDVMKSDFLSNVQHELRTPVMAIMGQIELMTVAWDKWDEATKLDLMKDMEIYTRQLKQIVDVMIDFSLFSSETLQLKQSAVGVRSAVEAVIAEMKDGFKGKLPVDIKVDIPSDLFVHADPARFAQVIQALLDNSVKFTPAGGNVGVRASVTGEQARIEVADNGIGIPEEAIPRIFEQFFQADSSKTRTFGGLGMGLALVERLTEAHGARVEVKSRVGEGSLFTILWPLAREAAVAPGGPADGFHKFDAGTQVG